MKKICIIILFVWSLFYTRNFAIAQYNQQYNSSISGLFGYGIGSAPSTIMLGDAAIMNAQANLILNQSYAAINYETVYSMKMNNNILRTQTFFEMRQINRYYRDLEEWQIKERAHLKKYGLYDRSAIESMYAPHGAGSLSNNQFGY